MSWKHKSHFKFQGIFIGNLWQQPLKGIDVLLEAWKEVVNQFDEVADLVHHNLSTILCTPHLAEVLSREAKKQGKVINIHIKVDTGMNRLGFLPENLLSLTDKICNLPNLKIEALSTHFSSADDEDLSITNIQIELFREALAQLK